MIRKEIEEPVMELEYKKNFEDTRERWDRSVSKKIVYTTYGDVSEQKIRGLIENL